MKIGRMCIYIEIDGEVAMLLLDDIKPQSIIDAMSLLANGDKIKAVKMKDVTFEQLKVKDSDPLKTCLKAAQELNKKDGV